ncbi:MAG: hypothetical protein ACRD4Q_15290 [Candidatus Acidiferrales bacterium]
MDAKRTGWWAPPIERTIFRSKLRPVKCDLCTIDPVIWNSVVVVERTLLLQCEG